MYIAGDVMRHCMADTTISIVRVTLMEWWFFVINPVIIGFATIKLDQNLERLTP